MIEDGFYVLSQGFLPVVSGFSKILPALMDLNASIKIQILNKML